MVAAGPAWPAATRVHRRNGLLSALAAALPVRCAAQTGASHAHLDASTPKQRAIALAVAMQLPPAVALLTLLQRCSLRCRCAEIHPVPAAQGVRLAATQVLGGGWAFAGGIASAVDGSTTSQRRSSNSSSSGSGSDQTRGAMLSNPAADVVVDSGLPPGTATTIVEEVLAGTPDAPRKLAVLGLPWETCEDTLRTHFAAYGVVEAVEIMKDRMSGKSRGFGFVTFVEAGSAARALAVEHTIDGRRCEAKVALPKVRMLPTTATRVHAHMCNAPFPLPFPFFPHPMCPMCVCVCCWCVWLKLSGPVAPCTHSAPFPILLLCP